MRYYSKEDIKNFFGEEAAEKFFNFNKGINVKFCRDCEGFECDGIQPEPGVIHGRCYFLTPEPPYLRVTENDFCNGDEVE